nr:D-alanyl-D-alanine carboxypeptidase/D-alanyl-D-alanine-endopeptidase [Thiospirillum jenense]
MPDWGLKPAQVSIYVRRVDADTPLVFFNPEQPRIPASTIKLVTTIVGLDVLGTNYRWTTQVYTDGNQQGEQLIGNLYIKGFGNPYLSNGEFADLIRGIRNKGISIIRGNILLDNSYLDPPEQARADFDGAGQSAYNALPAALSINRQVTDIHVFNDRGNGKVGIYTDPPLSGVVIDNQAQLINAPCQNRYHHPFVSFIEATPTSAPTVRLTGQFASECGEEVIYSLMLSPEQHAAAAFDALWHDLGGQITGQIRLGMTPRSAKLLHNSQSQPLAVIIRDINKYSNNLMARMLFLTLGNKRFGSPGTLKKSRDAMAAWLTAHRFNWHGFIIDNGSGLSRHTRIAAGDFGELLTWAYRQPWMPELLSSMAIAGIDGTVRKRLRQEPIAERAHLKTGTVRDASCIAGFVLDRNNQRWVVVVMVNADSQKQALGAWQGHAVQHEILRWVYQGAPLNETIKTTVKKNTKTRSTP